MWYLLYGKIIWIIKKVKVYDEDSVVGIGDCVLLMEMCLLLVIKCWWFVEIFEKVK